MSRYLEAASSAIHTLLEKQTVRFGGDSNGALCVTVSALPFKDFHCVGRRVKDATFNFFLPGKGVEMEALRMDLRAWPVLELFSDVSGDPYYRNCVIAMAEAFGQHGFDPVSGLGYLGEMAEFDALSARPALISWATELYFKPCDDLPLDRMWQTTPDALTRMCHAVYYGLITRPETMDYNRFCEYNFDDSQKKHSMEFNSHHCACGYTAAYLIYWWGYLHARTGDADLLKWATALARKWKAAQNVETGLMPAWFGSDYVDEDYMPPRPFCNNWDSNTAQVYLRAAEQWKEHPDGRELARDLQEMGHRFALGMARYGYHAEDRISPQWINTDGTRSETTWYTFPSQAIKDEAVKHEPVLKDAFVFYGSGFYEGIRPWILTAGNPLPYSVAFAAKVTGDVELLEHAKNIASAILEESEKLTTELNAEQQWSFSANASYIQALLLIFETTGDEKYLEGAQALANRELQLLEALPSTHMEWWRMPGRNAWIESLLLLHCACAAHSSVNRKT
ncbi:MAG: hypothetical protein ABI443_10365 [Chthoniobacterales bacterium]